jgi:hypothetical protein
MAFFLLFTARAMSALATGPGQLLTHLMNGWMCQRMSCPLLTANKQPRLLWTSSTKMSLPQPCLLQVHGKVHGTAVQASWRTPQPPALAWAIPQTVNTQEKNWKRWRPSRELTPARVCAAWSALRWILPSFICSFTQQRFEYLLVPGAKEALAQMCCGKCSKLESESSAQQTPSLAWGAGEHREARRARAHLPGWEDKGRP